MELPSSIWYVKLFRTCLAIWARFKHSSSWDRDRLIEQHAEGTNLCFFVRTIFVWAPLAVAINAAAYALTIAVITVIPLRFFGGGTYVVTLGMIIGVVAAVIGIVGLLNWVLKRPRKPSKARPSRTPSAAALTREWLAARKAKICPMITFTDGGAR